MTFNMNDQSTRGFWWGDDGHGQGNGAMALTTDGKLTVAHSMRLGYGESDTTTPGGTATLETKNSGTGLAGYFENTSSNGTVMQLKTTGDNRSLYLQTDHIYASGELYLGDGGQLTRYRGASHTWQLTGSNTVNMTLNSNQLLFAQPTRLQFANDQRIFDDGGGGLKVGAEAHKLQLYAGTTTQEIIFLTGGRNGTERARITNTGLKVIDGTAANPSLSFTSDPDLGFYRNGANNIRFSAGNSIRGTWNGDGLVLNGGSLGVNVAVSTAADGRIDAGNDIVAFSSDKRLKQNIRFIENPLEKISQLSGFVYNWNELANKEAGYDMDKDYVGVFAQDVEKVQPEAVKIAPFDNDGEDNSKSGENYLTVQYEKMVPLLIESIKELKSIVETQNTTIEQQQQRLTKLEEKSNG
jgi:hypothetical protein